MIGKAIVKGGTFWGQVRYVACEDWKPHEPLLELRRRPDRPREILRAVWSPRHSRDRASGFGHGILAIHSDPLPIGATVIVADDESFLGVAGGREHSTSRRPSRASRFVRMGRLRANRHFERRTFRSRFGLISDAKEKPRSQGIGSMHIRVEDPALLVERIASLSPGIRRIDVIALVRDAAVQGTKRALGDVCSVLGWDVDDLLLGMKNQELPALFASAYAASEGALPGNERRARRDEPERAHVLRAGTHSLPSVPPPAPTPPPPAPDVGPGATVLVQRDGESLIGTIEQTAEDGQCPRLFRGRAANLDRGAAPFRYFVTGGFKWH